HPGRHPDPAVRPAPNVVALPAGAGRPGALPRHRRRRLRPHGGRGRGGANGARQRGTGMSAALRLTAAGPLSTLQDAGRRGWLPYGVAPAGAVDPLTLAVANALVGNAADAAGVEFTLMGDGYAVEAESALLAVAGDATVSIDDAPAAPWRSYRL